jgi:hypothetical protein
MFVIIDSKISGRLYMNNIIEFNKIDKNKNSINLFLEDILNLFLICKSKEGLLASFNLNDLIKSLDKNKDNGFNDLYTNLKAMINDYQQFTINLEICLERKVKEKAIIINPSNKSEIVIIGDDEYFSKLKSNYNNEIFTRFNDLMFYINNDLEFGIDNWEVFTEDEYISDSVYPGIVTGEFIGQKKDKEVMKKVRKRSIENLKNKYQH